MSHGIRGGNEGALDVGCDSQGSVESVALLAPHLWWGVCPWGLSGFLRQFASGFCALD